MIGVLEDLLQYDRMMFCQRQSSFPPPLLLLNGVPIINS